MKWDKVGKIKVGKQKSNNMEKLIPIIAIAAFLICGSLKPAIQPCSQDVTVRFYSNGKKVETVTQDNFTFNNLFFAIWEHKGKVWKADSLIIEMYKPLKSKFYSTSILKNMKP